MNVKEIALSAITAPDLRAIVDRHGAAALRAFDTDAGECLYIRRQGAVALAGRDDLLNCPAVGLPGIRAALAAL